MTVKEFQKCLIEKHLNKWVNGTWTIREDGSVDVFGDVDIEEYKGSKLPFRFGKIKGHFRCNRIGLTTLAGAPTEVTGAFGCHENNLTALKFAPKKAEWSGCCSNKVKFSEEDVRKICEVKENVYV